MILGQSHEVFQQYYPKLVPSALNKCKKNTFFDSIKLPNMGRPSAPVSLTERQHRILGAYLSKRNISIQERSRLSIILGAAAGKDNGLLSEESDLTYKLVGVWRRRWADNYAGLCEFEQGTDSYGVSDRELLKYMLGIISDLPRSGHPKRITLAQKQQIVALACRKPKEFGIPMTQWNREMLAQVAITQGIVDTISPRYIGVILKNQRATTS